MTRSRPPHLQLVTSEGREIPDACLHVARRHLALDSFRLTPMELLSLCILRHLCFGLSSQSTAGWERAHQVAESELEGPDAAYLVALVTALLRAIRTERPQRFSFMAADCPSCSRSITREELQVMRMLRAARDNDDTVVAAVAGAMCRGAHAPRIAASTHALGGFLAGLQAGSRPAFPLQS